ncbi:MAG TPA: type IV secretory system conjugative DNA transfer family protein [Acidimicrobiales bacterium]|nr:type IV secretory system conjugative DNA transfer family protein [Acidimicrobiales bacterium]
MEGGISGLLGPASAQSVGARPRRHRCRHGHRVTWPHPSWTAGGLAAGVVLFVILKRSGIDRSPLNSHQAGRSWRGVGIASGARARRSAGAHPVTGRGVRWALRNEIRPLVVRGSGSARLGVRGTHSPGIGSGSEPGRLVLGSLARRNGRPGRTLLAAEPAQSVAVIGPTQSGKTSGLAVPAILSWEGPVLAASVKTDLARDTISWRRRLGRVWCFDPGGTTGLPASSWSPLSAATTWAGARRVAADLTEVTKGAGTSADGEFWYATAAKLIAPLLFAAAHGGLVMGDVVRWVDTQEVAEVSDILEAAGVPEALQAARATWQRDERQRSGVYTTAETVLEPFADPRVGELGMSSPRGPIGLIGASGDMRFDTPPFGTPLTEVRPGVPRPALDSGGEGPVDPKELLLGPNTLYLCAPAHDQRRLRGLFTAVVKQVLESAFDRAANLGGQLESPLLVVLDEAANIAPLAELDGLAATCAGHGVQLITVWQDLAQVAARYGERAATVVNNHRAKVFLSGTSDPRTLDHASHLVGEEELLVPSVTRDASGARSVTTTPVRHRLLPPEALRRLPAGSGVLVYGSLPPVRLALRPWFEEPALAGRGRPDQPVSLPGRVRADDPA